MPNASGERACRAFSAAGEPAFDHARAVQHDDVVGGSDDLEPVRNHDNGAPAHDAAIALDITWRSIRDASERSARRARAPARLARNARASARRCRSPADRARPRSPTTVRSRSGRPETKRCNTGRLERAGDVRTGRVRVRIAHVVVDRRVKEHGVLLDDAHVTAHVGEPQRFEVPSVEAHDAAIDGRAGGRAGRRSWTCRCRSRRRLR